MEKSILGIDVSKRELVVTLLNNGRRKASTFSNDLKGYKELDKWVQKQATTAKVLACAEATGHYSEKVADYLYSHGYDVSIVNPYCIKSYAQSKLTRHKNDQVDANIIAEYAKVHEVNLYAPRDSDLQELRSLYRCLASLKDMKVKASNHLECKECLPRSVQKVWKDMVCKAEKKISEVEGVILKIVQNNECLLKQYNNLQTIPGISKTSAIAILAEIPDISNFKNARQLAAYAGLTPRHRTSGSSLRGRTRISKIGSANLRKALYFPAIVAKKYNPIIKLFCKNLEDNGKHAMAIICAAERKLIHIVYAVLKHGIPFNSEISIVTKI